jgi:hypothetical protein
MRRRRAMGMGVAVVMAMAVMVVAGMIVGHGKTLHYNITGVHAPSGRHPRAGKASCGNPNWASLAGMSQILLARLAPAIHLGTLMMVPAGTRRRRAALHVPAARDRSGVLALEIVARDSHLVSFAVPAVRGMAGAARDQGCCADYARRLARTAVTPTNPDATAPETAAALISNTDRCGRSDHPHGRVGVTGAVEVDVNDPQDEQGDKCSGDGFHDLLTMRIRHGFRCRNS